MRWTRPILLVVVPLVLAVGAGVWWLWSGRYVATENAYVKADIGQGSSEVPGRIIDVKVREHAQVAAGDVLLTVDPEPFAIALAFRLISLGLHETLEVSHGHFVLAEPKAARQRDGVLRLVAIAVFFTGRRAHRKFARRDPNELHPLAVGHDRAGARHRRRR